MIILTNVSVENHYQFEIRFKYYFLDIYSPHFEF